MKICARIGSMAFALFISLSWLALPRQSTAEECVPANQWFSPGAGENLDLEQVLSMAKKSGVVLLGEHHGNPLHHVWQRDVLAAISEVQPKLVIALEMLPSEDAAAVTRFVNGEYVLEDFVAMTQWDDYWAYPVELYAPLLEFIHERKIVTRPVNVARRWLDAVSQQGLDAVLGAEEKPPFAAPAAAPREYLLTLARSFSSHRPAHSESGFSPEEGQRFKRFVDVQLTWDKALADGVKELSTAFPDATIVLIAGSWHLVNGHGVVWQLKQLGIDTFTVLIPWDEHLGCDELNPEFADAVYYPQ